MRSVQLNIASKPPPESVDELMQRAAHMMGQTFGTLCQQHGYTQDVFAKRHKGGAGELIERVLGADARNHDGPDLMHLGIEIKTLPLDERGRVAESTYVCRCQLDQLAQAQYEQSRLYAKTRQILFVCIDGAKVAPFAERTVGLSFLWSPTPAIDPVFRADWTDATDLIASGFRDGLDARRGQIIQVRPKGRNQHDTMLLAQAGEQHAIKTCGFYIRQRFTNLLIDSLAAGDTNQQQQYGVTHVSTHFGYSEVRF